MGVGMKFQPPLWTHQQKAILLAGSRFGLFFDPGCGKTRTAIEIWKRKHAAGLDYIYDGLDLASGPLVNRTIIFAPLNVCRNWQNELNEYLERPFESFLVAGQTKANKLKTISEFGKLCSKPADLFLICNIESLRSKPYREALLKVPGVDTVIVDESHNFKSPTSLQTKGLFQLVDTLRPRYLYLLSGTPAPQGEIDLWSTFRLLGKTNDNFFIWRKKHFDDKNERRRGTATYWPEYVVRKSSSEEFKQLLSTCSLTAKKSEVLDLPPLLKTTMYAELSKEQAVNYASMEEYLFAIDSEGNELNATNYLSRTLRLQQILCGIIGEGTIKDIPRLDTLRDAIDLTSGAPFIVWTIFRPTYAQLGLTLRDLGIDHAFLTGEQTVEERHVAMERFQVGKIRALIAHPKAGGIGVNLTAASYSIHYARSFSLTDDLQAEARNYRGGSEIHDRITRIDIVTPDTIDEEIVTALRQKATVQEFILGLRNKKEKRERQREHC